MKRLSTIFMTLAFLFGVAGNSAKAETVYSIDYSELTSFPFYVMGFTPEWVDGVMTDNGSGWHQYFIADGIPTKVGNNYKVKALVRAAKNITFTVNMGWGWGDGEKIATDVTVPASTEFVEVEWEYSNIGGTSCNLVAQPNFDGVNKIEWKELSVYVNDSPVLIQRFGDFVSVTPTMYVKNYGESDGVPATPNADGEYTTTDEAGSGDAWAAQFWIAAPSALSTGQQFKVEFDYKADAAGSVETQTHGAYPGSYITWHCIGNVDFTTAWKNFNKTQTVDGEMGGLQSIAFNMHLNSNTTYYIRNISLQVQEYLGEAVEFTITSAGWASFSYNKAVSLGTTNGYAVKAHGTYVELIPVTEVPANNAILIEGTNKQTFDVITSAAAIAENDLLLSDGTVEGDGSTIYALGKSGDEIGFMKVKAGSKIPAGKAYLVISGGDAREFIGIGEGETTGIHAVEQEAKVDNQYYNLAGQRVANPQKGVYIVNGKKVVIK